MINSPNTNSDMDADKSYVISTRLEDSKRLLKSLNQSVTDSLNSFSAFGRSLFKLSRNLHFSFNHADPSYICKLTLNLLTRQAKTSQIISLTIDEGLKALTKEISDYEHQIELVRNQSADLIAENMRHLTALKANYEREKTTYEKIAKETEALVERKKRKMEIDPLLHYNRNHKKKLKKRLADNIKNLRAAEQQMQDCVDQCNVRQQIFDVVLNDNLKIFKENFRRFYSNISEIIRKHNRVLRDTFNKELENFDSTHALSFTDGFSLPTDAVEQQYLDQRKNPQADSPGLDPVLTREVRDPKGKFAEVQGRLLTSNEQVSDAEVFEFVDVAQKQYETALSAFEERFKVLQGFRVYIQDLSNMCTDMDATFQKLSNNRIGNACQSTLCKKAGEAADPLLQSFGRFADNFQRFAIFLNSKASTLGSMTEYQRDSIKAFQTSFVNAYREYSSIRMSYVNTGMQQDKLAQRILEIADINLSDERLPLLRSDLDAVKKARDQQTLQLRRLATEAARGSIKAFEDYRNQENSRFAEFSQTVKGVLSQEYDFFKGVANTFISTEECLSPTKSKSKEEDIIRIYAQDEGMLKLFQYLEPEQGRYRGAQTIDIGPTSPLVFERLYTVPDNILEDSQSEDDNSEHDRSDEGETKLEKKFGLKSGQKLLDSFACAVEQKIIRQGRMYIYNNLVCFSTARILGDLAIVVPVEEIMKVEKKVASLVFDTSLALHTTIGEIKFISFFYRDKAFNLIQSIMKDADLLQPPASPSPAARSFQSSRKNSKADSPVKSSRLNEKTRKAMREDLILNRLNRKASSKGAEDDLIRGSVELTESDGSIIQVTPDKDPQRRKSQVEFGSQQNLNLSPNKRISYNPGDYVANENLTNHDEKKKFNTAQYLSAHIATPMALAAGLKNDKGSSAGELRGERLDSHEDFTSRSNQILVERILTASPVQNERTLKSAMFPSDSFQQTPSPDLSNRQSLSVIPDHVGKEERSRSAGIQAPLQQAKEISFRQRLLVSQLPKGESPSIDVSDNERQSEEVDRKAQEAEEALNQELQAEEEQKRKLYKNDIEQKRKKIQGLIMTDDKFPTVIMEEVLPCTAADLYNIAFSDRRVEHKGKTYDSCWMIGKTMIGDTDIEHIKWKPKAPFDGLYSDNNNLECLKACAEGPRTSERNFKYTHPVKEGGPFVPKTCPVEEKHYGYWLGPDEFVVQNEIFTSKVPMSDTFVVRNSFKVKDLGQEKCSLKWLFNVDFVKSTMFKGKISKSGTAENIEFATKIYMPLVREQMAAYLAKKKQDLQQKEAQKASQFSREKSRIATVAVHQTKLEKEINEIEQDIGIEHPQIHVTLANQSPESKRLIYSPEKKRGNNQSNGESNGLTASGENIKEHIEEEFNKFVKITEKNTERLTEELKSMKTLMMVMIAMNGLLFLVLLIKSF